MVSTFTPNIQIEEPARGDDVGTWDTPVNNNSTLLDLVSGGATTINISAGNVTLSAAQFRCSTITFNSTLLADVIITFPTSFTKSYNVRNVATGSSAFVVSLTTTAAGAQAVTAPPGDTVSVINDGANLFYHNMGRIGSYMDLPVGSVPRWISNCTVQPYLDCNGQTFSAATYPGLAAILGSTTVPDFRGRLAAFLNEGTGRMTSAGTGVDGNTLLAVGTNDGINLTASQIPTITSSGSNFISVTPVGRTQLAGSNGAISNQVGTTGANFSTPQSNVADFAGVTSCTGSNLISVTYNNGSPAAVHVPAPVLVGGMRFIRAG